MAELSSSQEAQKRLVENATLLKTLRKIPGQPQENELHQDYDERRQLSWEREKQLADGFAFISATTDDTDTVMAACIEEDPDKCGMTIGLASNTGVRSHVTKGFEGIARILEEASLRSKGRSF